MFAVSLCSVTFQFSGFVIDTENLPFFSSRVYARQVVSFMVCHLFRTLCLRIYNVYSYLYCAYSYLWFYFQNGFTMFCQLQYSCDSCAAMESFAVSPVAFLPLSRYTVHKFIKPFIRCHDVALAQR